MKLQFDRGSLLLEGVTEGEAPDLPEIKWDKRVRRYRAPAWAYRDIVLSLREQNLSYQDLARQFQPLALQLVKPIEPRSYQTEALTAFQAAQNRGVVVLPTGAGKTILAVMAIVATARPTLIHVPTIDLLHQWHGVLTQFLGIPIGRIGGGYRDVRAITVSTYDSAILSVDRIGNQFGFLVFDECHRLPAEQALQTAIASMAPFRLGLSATPERIDGRDALLDQYVGPRVYEAAITELAGMTLAPYRVETIEVSMLPDERETYEHEYALYRDFVRSQGLNIGSPQGWQQFIIRASQSKDGRRAFKAYRMQKRLSQASRAKDQEIWQLLQRHHKDRVLIFTSENATAYRIGREFILPVLTHQTRPAEREAFLNAFRDGSFSVMVTSKVLNEGVDVPDANVAIVVSGSASVREHVQRLGRILRAKPGKQALLYELISEDTREFHVNRRRRQHDAYQGFNKVQ